MQAGKEETEEEGKAKGHTERWEKVQGDVSKLKMRETSDYNTNSSTVFEF